MAPMIVGGTAEMCVERSAAWSEAERFQRLVDAMMEMAEELRVVMVLIHLEGLTAGEAAHVLDLPESVVAERLAEAVRQVRARVREGERQAA